MVACLGDCVILHGYILIKSQAQPALIKYLNLSSCISFCTSVISEKIINFDLYYHYCVCSVNTVS